MSERTDRLVQVYDLLYRLGAIANYTGFFYTSYGILLLYDNPEKLLLITKRLYPEIAKYYHTNWKAVERNIRTIVTVVWEKNPRLLSEFARHSLLQKPTNSQFLAILLRQLPHPPIAESGVLRSLQQSDRNIFSPITTEKESSFYVK